jgi:antitoxin component YwqK of YwqJK toxin-antitoxin module
MKTYKVTVDEKGTTRWYINGELHREDGPSVEWTDGTKFWFLNGKFHREDGPAVEHANGAKAWYLNGKYLTEEEFNNKNKPCIGKKVIIDGTEYTLN